MVAAECKVSEVNNPFSSKVLEGPKCPIGEYCIIICQDNKEQCD